MASLLEASAALVLAFIGAFPRFSQLGVIKGLGGTIVTTPSPLIVSSGATIGTVVATLSVAGGSGSYSFALISDASGYFSIVGNQLLVNAALSPGTDAIVIQANNGAGDVITLNTVVLITATGLSGQPMGLLLALTYP
jgi:hypothetical protein